MAVDRESSHSGTGNVVILLREAIKKEGRALLGKEGRIENITGQLLCMQTIWAKKQKNSINWDAQINRKVLIVQD